MMTTQVEAKRSIPFFNYRGAFAANEPAFVETFRDVLQRGAFIQQRDLADFERHLAEYLGVKHAFGVGNATDGLIMCWRAAGLQAGDEVIVPSHTMVATAAAIHFAGGSPVLVDCGPDHLIDPNVIEAAITPRTKAICPVQLNGRTADMHRLAAIAERHGLYIIEDAAQALGSKFDGRLAGTFGRAAAFSFYPAKLLGCLGDGGAVVTNDDAIAEKLLLLRDHGRAHSGEIETWGLNSRLDNLQAAFLDLQLKTYDEAVTYRRGLATRYHARLADIDQLTLPPAPDADSRHFDVYQNFEIQAERRDELRAFLQAHNVGTIVQWGGRAIHQNPKLGFTNPLPATDRLFERCLMLPMNVMVTHDDVDYIADVIRQFYAR
jgi:dTDP-4-amino-4,6-dideoxygalactose transaminase